MREVSQGLWPKLPSLACVLSEEHHPRSSRISAEVAAEVHWGQQYKRRWKSMLLRVKVDRLFQKLSLKEPDSQGSQVRLSESLTTFDKVGLCSPDGHMAFSLSLSYSEQVLPLPPCPFSIQI